MIDYDFTLKFDITSLECEPESLQLFLTPVILVHH